MISYGLAVKPLLMAAANFANADGVGMLNIDVKGEGANLQALMSSLAGDGKFNLSNGVLNGVDLTALVKAAKTAFSTKSMLRRLRTAPKGSGTPRSTSPKSRSMFPFIPGP